MKRARRRRSYACKPLSHPCGSGCLLFLGLGGVDSGHHLVQLEKSLVLICWRNCGNRLAVVAAAVAGVAVVDRWFRPLPSAAVAIVVAAVATVVVVIAVIGIITAVVSIVAADIRC